MTNRNQIDTTTDEGRRQLRREIAERHGWTVVKTVSEYGTPIWYLLTPSEEIAAPDDLGFAIERYSEAEAWADAPDYPNDLNAALQLRPLRPIEITVYADGSVGTEPRIDNDAGLSLATRYCLVWLRLELEYDAAKAAQS